MSDHCSTPATATTAADTAPALEAVWKLIYLARRNPALAAEDFPAAWRSHSALGRQCPNVGQRVRAVAQCSRVLDAPALPGLNHEHDGVNLLVLGERADGDAIWHDPETLAVMRPDEPRVFADYVRNCSVLCRQQVLLSQPGVAPLPTLGDVLLVGFLQRQADHTPWPGSATLTAQVSASWCQGALGQARRVVANAVDDPPPPGYGFRWVVEWWFPSVDAALAGARAAAHAAQGPQAEAWGAHVLLLTQVTHSRP